MKHSLKTEDYIYVNGCCVRKGLTEEPKVGTWCFYPFFQDRLDPVEDLMRKAFKIAFNTDKNLKIKEK